MSFAPKTRPHGKSAEDVELVRYFNDAAMGLNALYDAAAAGDSPARQKLRDFADRLVRAAGNARRILEAKGRSK